MTAPPHKTGPFPRQLAQGLWVVGNYYFNLYVVKGDQAAALIEVGVSAVVDDVMEQLDSLRVSPSFLVVTHPHSDHVTGLPGLQEKYPQALVVTGEGASEFLTHPKAVDGLTAEDARMTDFLTSVGIVPGRRPVSEVPTLQDCLVARDGDEIDLGGRTLRFLEVRGHSPGAVVVYVPEIRALMLSDSMGFRYPGRGVFPIFFTSFADYMEALARLEGLNPLIVGPAHQGPLSGDEVTEAFRESRTSASQLRSRIMDDPRAGDEIAEDLLREYYRDELTMYTRENILNCAKLVVKRARD